MSGESEFHKNNTMETWIPIWNIFYLQVLAPFTQNQINWKPWNLVCLSEFYFSAPFTKREILGRFFKSAFSSFLLLLKRLAVKEWLKWIPSCLQHKFIQMIKNHQRKNPVKKRKKRNLRWKAKSNLIAVPSYSPSYDLTSPDIASFFHTQIKSA